MGNYESDKEAPSHCLLVCLGRNRKSLSFHNTESQCFCNHTLSQKKWPKRKKRNKKAFKHPKNSQHYKECCILFQICHTSTFDTKQCQISAFLLPSQISSVLVLNLLSFICDDISFLFPVLKMIEVLICSLLFREICPSLLLLPPVGLFLLSNHFLPALFLVTFLFKLRLYNRVLIQFKSHMSVWLYMILAVVTCWQCSGCVLSIVCAAGICL